MSQRTKQLLYVILALCIVIGLTTMILCTHRRTNSDVLRFIMLDIGQGDALYIEAPNGRQMIIDGGPKNVLAGMLQNILPRGDKSIDVLVITNPDADHIHGFKTVLDDYAVGAVIEPGTYTSTQTYRDIETRIAQKNIPRVVARAGMRVVLDSERNIYFEILFPDREVSNMTTNDGSIIGRLVYRNTSYLLTGDATLYTESLVARKYGDTLASNVLKVGHHGSRTSTGGNLLSLVRPSIALISAGFHNSYGHPHREVTDRLMALKIPYYVTLDHGNIEVDSDGEHITTKVGK